MHLLWSSLLTALRRRREPDRSPGRPRIGTGAASRMLLAEAGHVLRLIVEPTRVAAAVMIALITVVALGPATPGLSLDMPLRLGSAAVLGLAGAVLAGVLQPDDRATARTRPRYLDAVVAIRVLLGGSPSVPSS